MSTTYTAIIFDMDGTLVNSEQLHIDTWAYIFSQYNLPLTEQDVHQWIGVSDVLISKQLVNDFNLAITPEQLLLEKRTYYQTHSQPTVQALAGVREGIARLKGIPMAIATMSSKYEAKMSLQYTGLSQYFDIVITADDVPNHKPAPDCYLLAAQGINAKPSRCIALEDSVSGVSAAKAAGMFTIGLGNTIPLSKLEHADICFKDSKTAFEYLFEIF